MGGYERGTTTSFMSDHEKTRNGSGLTDQSWTED